MKRTYYVGLNMQTMRLTIIVNMPHPQIPFTVWRDVGRLAGMSHTTPTTEVFEFLCNDPKDVAKAERVLQGACFKREETLPSDYEACGSCGFDHGYEYEYASKWHTKNPGDYDHA